MWLPARVTSPRLDRRLGLRDSVAIGLGSMLGAGVFAAPQPAAQAAGTALLIGLAIAAVVAYCNATSSARLAAIYPESGGTYVYGRERLGELWGFLAGAAFVLGKLASLCAMALTFGAYVAPGSERPLAVALVVAMTAVNALGITKTAAVTRAIVAFVLATLAFVVVAVLTGGDADAGRLTPLVPDGVGPFDVLQSAAFMFFAFAGYARIATLGEEVVDPARTIPRAIRIAFAVAVAVYALTALAALAALGGDGVAAAEAPLAKAAGGGVAETVVRAGAAVAAGGVLLSLLAGVGRTVFAMARRGDLPRPLAAVDERRRVPLRAELAVGAIVVAEALLLDLRGAIGFSSFCVLLYYAIANASALTLDDGRRALPAIGLAGCLILAFTLPIEQVGAGAAAVGAATLARAVVRSS
jgi:APA family basic amino acid/polyamine antiporter